MMATSLLSTSFFCISLSIISTFSWLFWNPSSSRSSSTYPSWYELLLEDGEIPKEHNSTELFQLIIYGNFFVTLHVKTLLFNLYKKEISFLPNSKTELLSLGMSSASTGIPRGSTFKPRFPEMTSMLISEGTAKFWGPSSNSGPLVLGDIVKVCSSTREGIA